MKQKLICVTYTDSRSEKELAEALQEGWVVKQISGAGANFTTRCWVLLERPEK